METREVKVYRAIVSRTCADVDMDMCPTWTSETIFDDYFASKKDAIAAAQSKFARQPLNIYVRDVHAEVRLMTISKGAESERIYNKFKER